jgi:preprotein translocase subunit SecD
MKKNLRIRSIIILLVTVASLWLVLRPHGRWPVLADVSNWNQVKQNLSDNIHLGLDLKGGIHLVMQVQAEEAVQAHIKTNADQVTKILTDKGIQLSGEPAIDAANHQVTVKVADVGKAQEANDELLKDFNSTTIGGRGWTSAVSGDAITLSLSGEEARRIRESAHQQAIHIVENRVNQFGVAEPVVTATGGADAYQILLQLPGVDDPERVKKLLQAESNLELRPVVGEPIGGGYPTPEAALQAGGGAPEGVEALAYTEREDETTAADQNAGQPKPPTGYLPISKEVIVRGQDLRDAIAVPDQFKSTNYEISFSLKPAGAERFGEWTGKSVGRYLAIVLTGQVRSAPRIQSQITDRGQITGKFTKQQAEDLALVLRSGALPARITYLEERTVGPSLGADSIRQGLISSVAGLLAVCIFLLFYYRFSGINAIVALILNLVILLAAIAWTGATLTLPGIAGVILLIGMAVDSNVLIFERIREELRNGKVVRSAVDTGFNKAFTTIMDTHVTTIVSAIFLFVFGTGPIRGFAVTLIAGLLANLFTAVFVSRTMFSWVLNRGGRPAETISI